MKMWLPKAAVVIVAMSCSFTGCGKGNDLSDSGVEISTLYERYADVFGPGHSQALIDIKSLCVSPDKRALPQLTKILGLTNEREHEGLYCYDVARAVFCIGTPEAHQILAKYLLVERPQYSYGYTHHAFDETLKSKMDVAKQSDFIETYLFRNLSKSLDLTVLDKVEADSQGRLTFTVRMRNLLKSPLVIQIWIGHRAHMLYLRSRAGRHIPRFRMGIVDANPWFVRLRPGGFYDYKILATLHGPPTLDDRKHAKVSAGTSVYMDVELLGYDLVEPGRFTVRAILETPLYNGDRKDLHRKEYERYLEIDRKSRGHSRSMWLAPEMEKDHEQDESPEVVWEGRAVSPPVEIDIPPAPSSAH